MSLPYPRPAACAASQLTRRRVGDVRSINEAVCHGIPDSRALEEGDICNVDVSVYYKGYHGDVNDTFFVGEVSPEAQKLVQVTYEALEEAIKIGTPILLPLIFLSFSYYYRVIYPSCCFVVY